MLTFLFWNMGGNNNLEPLGRLSRLHSVDLLVISECPADANTVLRELNRGNATADRTGFRPADTRSLCSRVLVFPRFPQRYLLLRAESDKYTSRIIRLPGRPELIVFAVHFASKRHRSEDSQILGVPGFSNEIRRLEKKAGHARTIVIGDLNMNPYESGLVGAEGMNAVMTREIALRGSRRIDGADYPYFYNPMWSHFGDSSNDQHPPSSPNHEPPGTCYYPSSESRWYFWNMFDQALIRPDLLEYFRSEAMRILVSDGTFPFLDRRGLPDREKFSDHLPIVLSLDL